MIGSLSHPSVLAIAERGRCSFADGKGVPAVTTLALTVIAWASASLIASLELSAWPCVSTYML